MDRWAADSATQRHQFPHRRQGRDEAAALIGGNQLSDVVRVTGLGYLSRDKCLDDILALAISQSDASPAKPHDGIALRRIPAVVKPADREMMETASALMSALELKNVDHSSSVETLRTIQTALATGRQLSGQYFSPYNNQTSSKQVHPFRLCFIRSAWYLVARRDLAMAPQTYRVVRFRSLQAKELAAVVPEEFDLQDYLGNAWCVCRGDTRYELEIRFLGPAANVVY